MFFLLLSVIIVQNANAFVPNSVNSNIRSSKRYLVAEWADISSNILIPAPAEKVFDLYSQFDQHPTWSPWLVRVEWQKDSPLTTWTLKSLGLSYSWKARNIILDRPNCIEWESIDGLSNKGRVIFEQMESKMTKMTLVVSFNFPGVSTALLNQIGSVQSFAEETISQDLRRFRRRLLTEIQMGPSPG